MFPLFATGVIDTGSKFAAGVVDTSGKFATGINDTSNICGTFAASGVNTGVVDTGGKFERVGTNMLPCLLLTSASLL